MKKEIIGYINCDCFGNWFFSTKEEIYGNNIVKAIDELLEYVTEGGDKIKITIEKLN